MLCYFMNTFDGDGIVHFRTEEKQGALCQRVKFPWPQLVHTSIRWDAMCPRCMRISGLSLEAFYRHAAHPTLPIKFYFLRKPDAYSHNYAIEQWHKKQAGQRYYYPDFNPINLYSRGEGVMPWHLKERQKDGQGFY